MRGLKILLLAVLQCSGLACGQEQNCTGGSDLQIVYKTFAQNQAAFNVLLELLPGPTEAQIKKQYLAWLESNEGQATSASSNSPRLTTEVLASILTAAASNTSAVPMAPPPVPSALSPADSVSLPAYGAAYGAAPAAQASVSADGAAGAPSAVAEGILPLSPLAMSPQPLTSSTQLNFKKGAGMYHFSNINDALEGGRLSWTYNWWHMLDQGVALPGGVQYVPMIFSASYATPAIIALAKLSGSDALLGFNEPNEKVQAANTVQQALAAWPTLMASGLRLGSPAVSIAQDGTRRDSWLGQFMQQITINGYHVDFMSVHWYGSKALFGDPAGATAALQAYLQAYYDTYRRNMWLTEWALVDFGNDGNGWAWTFASYDQQVAFMQQAIPMLDKLGFVERYAWYMLYPDQVHDGEEGQSLNTASLVYLNGSATPTGLAYQPV